MKRFLIAVLTALQFTTPAYGQIEKRIVDGDIFTGIFHQKNYLKNPEFEKNKLNITDASSIATLTSSAISGNNSLLIDATGSTQTVSFAGFALDSALKGQNCEFRGIFNGDASLYKVYVNLNSVKITSDLQLTNATNSQSFSINFPCGDGTYIPVPVIEATSASAAAIKVDKLYMGQATNVSNNSYDTDWATYTPSFGAGFGSPTNISFQYRRLGDTVYVKGTFTTGTVASSLYSISLPASAVIDSAKITSLANTTSNPGPIVGHYGNDGTASQLGYIVTATGTSSSLVYFGKLIGSTGMLTPLAATGSITSTSVVSVEFSVPVSSWTANATIRVDQSNFGWASYSPTVSGFGTTTPAAPTFYYKRLGDSMIIRGTWTNGTVAASLASFTLPGSFTIDSAKLTLNNVTGSGGPLVGHYFTGNANCFGALITATGTSSTLIYFGNGPSAATQLVPQNGFTIVGNSAAMAVEVIVPITGWSESQNAPLLVGSVTTGSGGAEVVHRANITCSSSSAINTSSSSWITLGNVASGKCIATLASGTFASANYSCVFMSQGTSVTAIVGAKVNNKAAASFDLYFADIATGSSTIAAATSVTGDLICMGPRL